MSEVVHQIVKGVKQIRDFANAPKELSAMIEKFGAPGEEVLHTAFARYWNTRKLLDKPTGVVLITNQRFLFVSKLAMVPFIKGTTEIVCSLYSIEVAENVKFRKIRGVQLTIDEVPHLFLVQYFIKAWKQELVD